MPLPAVLTIQSGISKLRYASLMGIKKAKTKEVKRLTLEDLQVHATSQVNIERVYLPQKIQADAIVRRPGEGSGGQAGREAQVRGACHMILVFLERSGSQFHRLSFETLAAGQQLGRRDESAGRGRGDWRRRVRVPNATVFSIEHPLLQQYTPDGYTIALEQLIRAKQPKYVLLPHTYTVRDFAPKLATRFERVLVSDVISMRAEGGNLLLVRQLFQGKLNADVRVSGVAPFVCLHPGRRLSGRPITVGIAERGRVRR